MLLIWLFQLRARDMIAPKFTIWPQPRAYPSIAHRGVIRLMPRETDAGDPE